MAKEPINPLLTELTHWHEVTRLRYNQFLVSVTALELEDASRHLHQFSRLLTTLTEFCEKRLNHLYDKKDDAHRLVRADHQILERTMEQVKEAMELLATHNKSTQRTALIEQLDVMVRMRNIMSRHYERQHSSLFPLVDKSLEPLEHQMLADKLTNKMLRAQPVAAGSTQVEPH